MKRMQIFRSILLLLFLSGAVFASPDDLLERLEPRGFVNDYAHVISPSEELQLDSIISELRQKTGAEMAVVTIQSLEGGNIDDFTNRLFERWGIGQKGKDNGLMFLCAMKERKMRIEVGYGLEGVIPDSKAGRIRREIITPYFKAGEPGEGIIAGVAALSREITGESPPVHEPTAEPDSSGSMFARIAALFGLVTILATIAQLGLAVKRGKGSGNRGTVSPTDLFRGGYGGGGFGGGGYSGGGGFGGGCSGGGGSSGGW
jgi:uncharacterized protein